MPILARHCANLLMCLSSLNPPNIDEVNTIVFLQMKKLRLKGRVACLHSKKVMGTGED